MSLMLLATFVFFVGSLFNSAGAQDSTQAEEGCTIVVQADESLQTAVEQAPEGAVLCLSDGTWDETLFIRKSLTLQGMGAGRSNAKAIRISSEERILVRVKGIRLYGPERSAVLEARGAAGVELLDLVISSGEDGQGIYLRDSARATIINSEITKNKQEGILLEDSAQAAIFDSEISENNRFGIQLNDSSQVSLVNVIVWKNRGGIHLTRASQATLATSRILGSYYEGGIVLEDSAQASVTGLVIYENDDGGLILQDSAQATLFDSEIFRNEVGILLLDTSRAIFSSSASGITTIYENISNGVVIQDEARADLTNLKVLRNFGNGVLLQESAGVTIERTEIKSNWGYGVALYQQPCFDTDDIFQGRVFGKDNFIPGPDEVFGNEDGAVCPPELEFLRTPEGGQYP